MSFTRRQLLQSTGASALLAGIGQRAFAQAGIETATIVTGFAAGGTSDTICRRVATKLSPDYARAAVVENRTGAGGQIAVSYVKGRPADGTCSVYVDLPRNGVGVEMRSSVFGGELRKRCEARPFDLCAAA